MKRKLLLLLIILTTITGLAAAKDTTTFDNFEDGDVAEWTGETTYFSTTTNAPNGQYAGEIDYAGGSAQSVLYDGVDSAYSEYTFLINISAFPGSSGVPGHYNVFLKDGAGTKIVSFRLTEDVCANENTEKIHLDVTGTCLDAGNITEGDVYQIDFTPDYANNQFDYTLRYENGTVVKTLTDVNAANGFNELGEVTLTASYASGGQNGGTFIYDEPTLVDEINVEIPGSDTPPPGNQDRYLGFEEPFLVGNGDDVRISGYAEQPSYLYINETDRVETSRYNFENITVNGSFNVSAGSFYYAGGSYSVYAELHNQSDPDPFSTPEATGQGFWDVNNLVRNPTYPADGSTQTSGNVYINFRDTKVITDSYVYARVYNSNDTNVCEISEFIEGTYTDGSALGLDQAEDVEGTCNLADGNYRLDVNVTSNEDYLGYSQGETFKLSTISNFEVDMSQSATGSYTNTLQPSDPLNQHVANWAFNFSNVSESMQFRLTVTKEDTGESKNFIEQTIYPDTNGVNAEAYLSNGGYTWSAELVEDGNTLQSTPETSFTVNGSTPSVFFNTITPEEGYNFDGTSPIEFSANISSNVRGYVNLYIDEKNYYNSLYQGDFVNQENNFDEVTVFESLSDGNYEYYFTLEDSFGEVYSRSGQVSFTVGTGIPNEDQAKNIVDGYYVLVNKFTGWDLTSINYFTATIWTVLLAAVLALIGGGTLGIGGLFLGVTTSSAAGLFPFWLPVVLITLTGVVIASKATGVGD